MTLSGTAYRKKGRPQNHEAVLGLNRNVHSQVLEDKKLPPPLIKITGKVYFFDKNSFKVMYTKCSILDIKNRGKKTNDVTTPPPSTLTAFKRSIVLYGGYG